MPQPLPPPFQLSRLSVGDGQKNVDSGGRPRQTLVASRILVVQASRRRAVPRFLPCQSNIRVCGALRLVVLQWQCHGWDACPSWQWHRTGSRWSPVRTLPVAPLWCDLGFFPNSHGNKAAANLRPDFVRTTRSKEDVRHVWIQRAESVTGEAIVGRWNSNHLPVKGGAVHDFRKLSLPKHLDD